ncbi:hypothetical protein L6452_44038 [Arctium lappa]|uniref:Uncharacterized protein n=1 Tax=Arctium lappa TaxID=4217 RepID=A0ACB8XFQ4_ARCLA|nr:hypothetical protein L6452_44038 [Arctium lappa]
MDMGYSHLCNNNPSMSCRPYWRSGGLIDLLQTKLPNLQDPFFISFQIVKSTVSNRNLQESSTPLIANVALILSTRRRHRSGKLNSMLGPNLASTIPSTPWIYLPRNQFSVCIVPFYQDSRDPRSRIIPPLKRGLGFLISFVTNPDSNNDDTGGDGGGGGGGEEVSNGVDQKGEKDGSLRPIGEKRC